MEFKKAHFIGIAGAGMSGVAKLLREQGVVITGSDQEVYPPISTLLEREKIAWITPYAASNIPADADVIVIGKNAKLIPETNPEVAAAYESVQKNLPAGRRVLSFPEVLAELSSGKETIVVAGSYGKSTSTALLAHCLVEAGLDPSFFIGAVPLSPSTNAHIGKGGLFVMEGDEYPTSNTDPRSKFLLMHPTHLLVTPLAHDHVNIFHTPESYLKPFIELLALPPEGATIVVCAEAAMSKDLLAKISRPTVTYGVHEGDFTAANIRWGEKTSFDIKRGDALLARIETTLLGEHNIQNIVGVATFLFSKQLITPEQFARAVATFRGIIRRLDKKSDKTLVPIFEGFGTSFEKAKSAVAAMKQHFPTRRLVIVFEPHTFSWRNREALHWYDTVFLGAAQVLVYEPASQGATTHAQSTQEEIVARIAASGTDAVAITSEEQTLAMLETELGENDCILLLTSGDLGGLIESIPKLAEQKFPK